MIRSRRHEILKDLDKWMGQMEEREDEGKTPGFSNEGCAVSASPKQ